MSNNRPDTVTLSGIIDLQAKCKNCEWEYHNRKNGLAIAKQHHNKTGHAVEIEIYSNVEYCLENSDEYNSWKTIKEQKQE